MAKMAVPAAVIAYQTAWVAWEKSEPEERLMLTTVPAMATPMAAPTWRLVEAMAAATPVWVRGMPAMALLEIAGLIRPRPVPKRA